MTGESTALQPLSSRAMPLTKVHIKEVCTSLLQRPDVPASAVDARGGGASHGRAGGTDGRPLAQYVRSKLRERRLSASPAIALIGRSGWSSGTRSSTLTRHSIDDWDGWRPRMHNG